MKSLRILPVVLLAGCATVEIPQNVAPEVTSIMSVEDNETIELHYTYRGEIPPEIDWDATLKLAKSRCQSKGYRSAETYEESLTTHCVAETLFGYSCDEHMISVVYECTNEGNSYDY